MKLENKNRFSGKNKIEINFDLKFHQSTSQLTEGPEERWMGGALEVIFD